MGNKETVCLQSLQHSPDDWNPLLIMLIKHISEITAVLMQGMPVLAMRAGFRPVDIQQLEILFVFYWVHIEFCGDYLHEKAAPFVVIMCYLLFIMSLLQN